MGILSEDQIRNYHFILSIARARLNALYAGKKMYLYLSGSAGNVQQCDILDFNIVPIEMGGTKKPEVHSVDEILKTEDVTDLKIMLSYSDNTGHQDVVELNTFLSANNIKDL